MSISKTNERCRAIAVSVLALSAFAPAALYAETSPSINTLGVPGLIDTPTAHSFNDADLATTFAISEGGYRVTLAFQITPRLLGSFRYSRFNEPGELTAEDGALFDRSFDLRYQLLEETSARPGVVIGLQDFMGTGVLGSEYIVASKTVAPGLTLSGGLGWGRLGSSNPIGSTGTRATEILEEGGIPNYDRWFQGDVAAFGGVSYSPTDRLTLKLEYSSDNYDFERDEYEFDGSSQWNAGIDYRVGKRGQLSLYSVYGTDVFLQYSIVSNPRISPAPSGLEAAPLPVAVRAGGSAANLGWSPQDTSYRTTLAGLMQTEGMVLEGMTLEANRAVVRINNKTYREVPQAIGRTARAMTRVLPASVETFVIVPTNSHVPLSAVTLKRSDIEALEHEAASEIYTRAVVSDAVGQTPALYNELYPVFTWNFGPELSFSAFDPDSPIRADVLLKFDADLRLSPNWLVSTEIAGSIFGNLSDFREQQFSGLPRVRTDLRNYKRETDVGLTELTLNHFGRPGKNLYSRVTAGYLEQMYGGLSAELLWKPVDSRLGLGVEINAVKQRAFDGGFEFRDYETVTGHASAYYEFNNGFVGRIDAGRYLAEDWGATVALDREFANGWRIGAFATFTDVSAEDFGEGSFDKGIRVTIPTSSRKLKASTGATNINIRSLTRDGGARVNVKNRLYDNVRRGHKPELQESWGRFWR